MPTRISADLDLQIIQALSTGNTNKQIAKEFNVSPSYVSKLKNGHKVPYIKIVKPTNIKDEFFEAYETDLDEINAFINSKAVIVDNKEIIEYLNVQLKKSIIRVKLLQSIINKFKGE